MTKTVGRQNSGTKLVIAVLGLALVLGATSWWYRYAAAHRASQFWGAAGARLIAESGGLEVITWDPPRSGSLFTRPGIAAAASSIDLSNVRGQAHLRHALMSDRNYIWGSPLDVAETQWRWSLRFHEADRQIHVVLADDLSAIGKYQSLDDSVTAYSCEPMAESLAAYFRALGLLTGPDQGAASKRSE